MYCEGRPEVTLGAHAESLECSVPPFCTCSIHEVSMKEGKPQVRLGNGGTPQDDLGSSQNQVSQLGCTGVTIQWFKPRKEQGAIISRPGDRIAFQDTEHVGILTP